MWFYEEEEEVSLGDLMRAHFFRQMLEERVLADFRRDVHHNELQEIQPEQLEEARRIKESGPSFRKVPTVEPEFGRFFNDPTYSDITLEVGTRRFHAHRLILSSWSSVFRDVLKPSEIASAASGSAGGLPSYRLEEDPECCNVFDAFLKFLYTEEISFTYDTIMPLLLLSNKYKVEELSKLCDNYMADLRIDVSSAVAVLVQAAKYKMAHAVESCVSILRSNFELMSPEQVQTLDSALIVALLESQDQRLVVKDEYSLFKKLIPWLTNCDEPDTFKTIVSCIRFPFMSVLQLREIGSLDILERLEEVNPTFLADAMELHSLYREAFLQEFTAPIPIPRLYLCPTHAPFSNSSSKSYSPYDEGGFMDVASDASSHECRNVLVKHPRNGDNRYVFVKRNVDDSWLLGVESFQETVKSLDTSRLLFGLKLELSQRHLPRSRYTYDRDDEPSSFNKIVEAAIQVKYSDGSSHIFADKCTLKSEPKIPFTFQTPCFLQSLPEKIKVRVSLVIDCDPKISTRPFRKLPIGQPFEW